MQSDKKLTCNCCEASFTSIDSAFNCLAFSPDTSTTADNRLLLFAFVNKDVKDKQKSGWNIIADQDIKEIAKRNYLLVIVDPMTITSKKPLSDEFKKRVSNHREGIFFVVTNQELYPFADWTETERKDLIIERLGVGMGP